MFFSKKRHEGEDRAPRMSPMPSTKAEIDKDLDEYSDEGEMEPEPMAVAHIPVPAPAPRSVVNPVYYNEPGTQAAPMFVKVEKYKEIIDSLQEIKNFVNGIKQLFVVISEIEDVRNDAIRIMRVSVQRLEKSATQIDQELLRPIGFENYPHGEAERSYVEESLTELQEQISKLRTELQAYKGPQA